MLFSQIESDTSTDRVLAVHIESDMVMQGVDVFKDWYQPNETLDTMLLRKPVSSLLKPVPN